MSRMPCRLCGFPWGGPSLAALLVLAAAPLGAQEFAFHTFDRQQLTDVYFSEGANAGDLNADGKPDVVYGPYWFEGPAFDVKREIYEPKPQNRDGYADNFFSWIHDFNGDGFGDVFVVGFPGTPAYVYENPGPQGFDEHWTKHQVFDWVSNESPHFTNLVGDERPEMVCTRDGYFGFVTVNWEKPFGAWTFHGISEKVAAPKFGHGLGVGDINGDGRLDVIHAKGWFEQPAERAVSSRWESHAAAFTNAGGGAEMYAYDVDGDGDNDVITSLAAHDFGVAWYEQEVSGNARTFKLHPIVGSHAAHNKYGVLFSEPHSVNLADVDGDGLKDLLTGKTYWSHHRQSPLWDAGAVVYWFRLVRGKDGVDWVPYLADGESGIGRQLSVADINGDGLLDIVVGGMKGSHVLRHKKEAVDQATWAAAHPKVYTGPPAPPEGTKPQGAAAAPAPAARGAGAIEGESLTAKASAGRARNQAMGAFGGGKWSGDVQLFWTGAKPKDTLTLPLPPREGKATLDLVLTKARDYGIVQLALDGQSLGGPIDLYSPQVVTTGVLSFPGLDLKAGEHTLTVEIVGANPKAEPAHMFGLDYMRFRAPGETAPNPVPARPSAGRTAPAANDGVSPKAADGRVLNLDFETGTLADWTAVGPAFEGQPIEGDTVTPRRPGMASKHRGKFWIGTFERNGDRPTGTLTSVPFVVTHPYASFLSNGGPHTETRVEIVRADNGQMFYQTAGESVEDLRLVVVDLRALMGKEIVLRIVDEHRGGWGHVNFDHFRFHEERPARPTPPLVQLVADQYPHGGLSAEEAAKAMKLPEGFRVTVGAAEPDVRQPIAMALDDRGRVWIAEAYEYPRRAQGDTGRDRILIFEDADGDGSLDNRKVFAEGLNLVSGLEVGFGGVWVGAAPYLLFIPDKNGDDVPDGEPQVLLDGWGFQDTHETLNAFLWGPDGWLYGCHGVFTDSNVGKPGTPAEERVPINAGIWRYHPVRHEFEVFAHGTSNPWGVDFNDHGQAFCTACVIPHLFHVIQGARYQRQAGPHFNTYTYRDIVTIADHVHYLGATPHGGNSKSDSAGGGHAHAGAMIYLGGRWPEPYRNQIFMNNIHGQRLNVDLLEPVGSGYVGHHGPDFLLTGDKASQILNLRYGPDGNAWMIDWYDMQACHRPDVNVHDRSNGRIYKISYGDSASAPVNLASKSDVELVELLLESNDWHARHARRLLQEQALKADTLTTAAFARMVGIARDDADDTRRLRAAWALHVTSGIDNELRKEFLKDASPYVRGWMIQLALEESEGAVPDELYNRLVKMASDDDSPIVRLYLASALQRMPLEQRWAILEGLVSHAADAKDHNLPLMYWYAAEPLAGVDPERALAFGLSAGETIPQLREFMLRRIGSGDGPSSLAALVRGLGRADSDSLRLTFLQAIRTALQGQRTVAPPSEWAAVGPSLAKSRSDEVRLQARALGVTFGDAAALRDLRGIVASTSAPIAERRESLQALLDANDPELAATLQMLIAEPPLREAALRGLAQYDDPRTPAAVLRQYGSLSPVERRSALATLCSRAEYGLDLLTAIEQKQVPGTDLTADLVRQLQYLKSDELTARLTAVWGNVRETAADKAKLIEQYKALASSHAQADAALGRAVFVKTCNRCHKLYGVGGDVGPDLTGSNRANLDYLLSNIVDPSAVMAKEHRQSIVVTDNGRVITGIVRSEDDEAVTIQTAEAVVVVPKGEIVERVASEVSMMPDDQLKPFSEQQITSLIAYLSGSGQSPILATPDNAALLFNGKDLTGWSGDTSLWSVENGEIVGRTSGLKRNEFLVSDLAAGDFRLSMEVKLVDNAGNSGVQFRSEAEGASVKGYQADIGQGWWGKLYEEHGRALLWSESGEKHLKPGDWNRYEIVAEGSRIRTFLNGQPCVDLDDPPGARRGVFALQLHSGGPTEVRYRNLKLEVLGDP